MGEICGFAVVFSIEQCVCACVFLCKKESTFLFHLCHVCMTLMEVINSINSISAQASVIVYVLKAS